MPKATPKGKPSAPGTAGYPEVERLIESEDFDDINRTFTVAYEKLDAVAGKKRGLKKSRDAQKGMRALELTMDLFRELLTIKYDLKARLAQQAKTK